MKLEGFDIPQTTQNDGTNDNTSVAVKKKKPGGGGSGFQSMGLSMSVFKGIMKKGYQMPSPIQRKVSINFT